MAKAEISKKMEEILRKYAIINAHQSEPYQQQQNPVESFVQDVKRYANYVYDYSGAPPESWVLIIHYVTYIMNRTGREESFQPGPDAPRREGYRYRQYYRRGTDQYRMRPNSIRDDTGSF